jgi:hypothetical protein
LAEADRLEASFRKSIEREQSGKLSHRSFDKLRPSVTLDSVNFGSRVSVAGCNVTLLDKLRMTWSKGNVPDKRDLSQELLDTLEDCHPIQSS